MKLEDISKKQPFKMPDEAHFDTISSRIYAQLEEEEKNQNVDKKSIFIDSPKTKRISFWVKPQIMGIAATFLLLLVALVGIYKYNSDTNSVSTEVLTVENNNTQKIDFSKISTEQINTFLLDEDISETELVNILPKNSTLNINSVLEESDLNSIDAESLDLMLEEEYL